jgi:hypothetical protein
MKTNFTLVHSRDPGDKTGRRFTGKPQHDPEKVWTLKGDHPAILDQRTLFPSAVVSAIDSQRLLISGANSHKLGKRVQKGAWEGFEIFQLSLEERASCPPTCNNRNTCYGNSMPFARRHRADEHLIPRLQFELAALQKKYPKGFVVRLHVLGDFFSAPYVNAWSRFLKLYPALHVFGYTAWPLDSKIGNLIAIETVRHWSRFAIRFSSDCSQEQVATTIWRRPEAATVSEGIVCPAQSDATACCATCGLCWAKSMRSETIVFVGHGGTKGPRAARAAA